VEPELWFGKFFVNGHAEISMQSSTSPFESRIPDPTLILPSLLAYQWERSARGHLILIEPGSEPVR